MDETLTCVCCGAEVHRDEVCFVEDQPLCRDCADEETFVCDNCGLIQDVFDDHFAALTKDLQQITREKTNFMVTQSDIEVHGICPNCQKKLGLA